MESSVSDEDRPSKRVAREDVDVSSSHAAPVRGINHVSSMILTTVQGSTFNVTGTSGSVTMVAGSGFFIKGDCTVVREGAAGLQEGVDDIQGRLKGIQDDKKSLFFAAD